MVQVFKWMLVLSQVLVIVRSLEQNCTGFEFQSSPIHESTAELLIHRSDFLHTPRWARHMIWHINPAHGKDFIVCSTPKSGTTRAQLLFYRLQKPNSSYQQVWQNFRETGSNQVTYNPIDTLQADELKRLLANESIPRFALVRDPYDRAVSGFQDKIMTKQSQQNFFRKHLGFDNHTEVNFENYVNLLYKKYHTSKLQNHPQVNDHFQPQSLLCGIDYGITYNYVLKSEQMGDWFDCFVDLLGIRDVVMHGWPEQEDCYLSTSKYPCNGPTIENGVLKQVDEKTAAHNTQSAYSRQESYQNKVIARMISEMYQQDIIRFNYSFIK